MEPAPPWQILLAPFALVASTLSFSCFWQMLADRSSGKVRFPGDVAHAISCPYLRWVSGVVRGEDGRAVGTSPLLLLLGGVLPTHRAFAIRRIVEALMISPRCL